MNKELAVFLDTFLLGLPTRISIRVLASNPDWPLNRPMGLTPSRAVGCASPFCLLASYCILEIISLYKPKGRAVMHHVRDVTLAEDALRSRSQALSRLMSSLRTLTINLLRRAKPKNMAAQLDGFTDKFHTLIEFMTQQLVL